MLLRFKVRVWPPAVVGLTFVAVFIQPYPAVTTTFVSDTYAGSQLGHFAYYGRWEHVGHVRDGRFFGSSSRSAMLGARVALSFVGSVVRVYGVRGRGGGYGSMTIDGKRYPDIDFYGSIIVSRVVVFSSPLLRKGRHTLVIAVIGNKRARGRRNSYINLVGAAYE